MIVLPSTSFVIFVSSFFLFVWVFFLISESNLLYVFYSKIVFALLLTFLSVLTFCCFSPFLHFSSSHLGIPNLVPISLLEILRLPQG